MTKYLHTMIRVSDPDATIDFFKSVSYTHLDVYKRQMQMSTIDWVI